MNLDLDNKSKMPPRDQKARKRQAEAGLSPFVSKTPCLALAAEHDLRVYERCKKEIQTMPEPTVSAANSFVHLRIRGVQLGCMAGGQASFQLKNNRTECLSALGLSCTSDSQPHEERYSAPVFCVVFENVLDLF